MLKHEWARPIDIGWPACNHWYNFLYELQQALARLTKRSYNDKNILFVSSISFEADGFTQRLAAMKCRFVRFNERGASNEISRYSGEGEESSNDYLLSFEGDENRIFSFTIED